MLGIVVKKNTVLATAFFLIAAIGASYLWYARLRVPELSDLHTLRSRSPDVFYGDNPICKAAMALHLGDFTRPVLVLTSSGTGEQIPHVRLRDVSVELKEIPTVLEGFFKTRAERTLFIVKDRNVNPQLVDRMLGLAKQSQLVDRVCVVDSESMPDWFPRTLEPRERL